MGAGYARSGRQDIMVLPGVFGTDLDLSAPVEAVVTKVGIDATGKPFRKDLPPVAKIPDEVMTGIDLKDYLGIDLKTAFKTTSVASTRRILTTSLEEMR